MKAREIAKKIAYDRAFSDPITTEELAPHMDGENITAGRLGKVQGAITSLSEQLGNKWGLNSKKRG